MNNLVHNRRNFNGRDTLPDNLDPVRHRIIAEHWFGLTPEDLRFQRNVQRLHDLGPGPLLYALREIGQRHSIATTVERTVEQYAQLDADVVHALGANELPALPIHEMPSPEKNCGKFPPFRGNDQHAPIGAPLDKGVVA